MAGLVASLVFAGAAMAAPPEPIWKLAVSSQPSNLVSGAVDVQQGFIVTATNVGATDTSGPITLETELPPGVSPLPSDCEVAGQRVICTFTESVPPGRFISKFIPVTVDAAAAGHSLRDVVTIMGGGVGLAEASVETEVGAAPPAFGFLPSPGGLDGLLTGPNTAPPSRAGETPYQLTIEAGFPSKIESGLLAGAGHPREIWVDFPPGLALNPAATPRCREAQLASGTCPRASQVGRITVTSFTSSATFVGSPLYNMVPPPGSAANLGFELADLGIRGHLLGSLRAGDFGLTAGTADIPARYPFFGLKLQLWGYPSDPAHDNLRGGPVEPEPRPLITLPSGCGPLGLTARANSWESAGSFVSRTIPMRDVFGDPLEVEGCGALEFEPTLSVKPSTFVTDSPAGLHVGLGMPQNLGPTGATTSSLRRAELTLPPGMVINPAAASGLAACTPAEIGLLTPVGQPDARFDGSAVSCPGASRIGTVEALTPLLEDQTEAGKTTPRPLVGSIYLAQPDRNPFGTPFAVYAAVDDPKTGVVIKLAGKVTPDPASGRLTATFAELPQLPFEAFKLDFFDGPGGAFRTPALCGEPLARAELAPWSGATPAGREDRFALLASPSGEPCATAPSQQPNAPRFDAGTLAPRAGRSSPFVLHLSRRDGSQEFASLNLALPPGLTGRLAGTPACPEAALAAAAANSGSAEVADPSCPAASRVGSVLIGLGAGVTPLGVDGTIYLAGPYRGAPLSLAVLTPAVSGPFDFGTVVVRVALFVDPRTGQLSAQSDRLPRILSGVPLDVRSLRLALDKPGLILNPTSCEAMSVSGETISTSGQPASLQSRFQVGECATLPFKPKLSLALSGSLGRNGHPAVRAVLRPGRSAAMAAASFDLPAGEMLDLRNLHALCPRGVAAERCPRNSRFGFLRLHTPLLEDPLEGAVYLRVPSGRLPDLTAEVRSGQFRFILRGRTFARKGRLGVSLDSLPDIPVARAVLKLAGGHRGIVVNSAPLCRGVGRASATISAHSGRRLRLYPRVRLAGDCRVGAASR